MKLTRRSTIVEATSGINSLKSKVTSICYSSDDERLAIATADLVISIYDDRGEQVDKFNTKPNNKGPKNYVVTGIKYAPEKAQYKLAVAQSDSIVFVYKWSLGSKADTPDKSCVWDGKKSICNKFSESSSVMTLVWPNNHPNDLAYGLVDGKVKLGQLNANKSQTIYRADSPTVSMTSHPNGSSILSAHVDGSIYKFTFRKTESQGSSCIKIIQQSYPAYAMSWGRSICASGENMITFYDGEGNEERSFNYDGDDQKDFNVASFNKSGDTVVVGNFDRFITFSSKIDNFIWEEMSPTLIKNMYSVTAMSWKSNGSCIALGTMCGLVEVYKACLRRYTHHGVEITHVSAQQIQVKQKNSADSPVLTLQSRFGFTIKKVELRQDPESKSDRYLVALTEGSLMFQDLESPLSPPTEVEWETHERMPQSILFDSPNACIVVDAGELSVIEYGENEVLGSFSSENINPRVLSLRIKEAGTKHLDIISEDTKKVIAYLLDQHTIVIRDLVDAKAMQTVSNDSKIDFIELNPKANFVLFRDKTRALHLYDIANTHRRKLLDYCSYAQWVPNSNVVVAQSRDNMCVWYNIHTPDQVVTRKISGEIEAIERLNGKTEIIVDDGSNITTYDLSEGMIGFASAVENMDVKVAVGLLEKMEKSTQSNEMWNQLQEICISHGTETQVPLVSAAEHIAIASHCAAAVGDLSRAFFLKTMLDDMKAKQHPGVASVRHWRIQAKMYQLKQEFEKAEELYIENGKLDELIAIYEEMNMYPDVIRLCEQKNPSILERKHNMYLLYLRNTMQDKKAAEVKANLGEHTEAATLMLRANLPLKAFRILVEQGITQPQTLIDSVVLALTEGGMHEQAGDLHNRCGKRKQALESFIKGKSFMKGIDLARFHFPNQIVNLELAWAEHLVSLKRYDSAVDHFIEAHELGKAIDAAFKAKRFDDACRIADQLDDTQGLDEHIKIQLQLYRRNDVAHVFRAQG